MERHDVVVVGAGHAGLAVSRELANAGIEHVVLERDEIGSTWRNRRWDTFRLNTPNSLSVLPGDEARAADDPGAFLPAAAFADRLAAYAADRSLPVRVGVRVDRLRPADGGFGLDLAMAPGAGPTTAVGCRAVVVASGSQNVGRTPPIAPAMPRRLGQLHALDYRRAGDLPDGAVLVVGCGQTGAQVAEDLLDAGRRVFLVPSKVSRCPRRHRGTDMLVRLVGIGMYEMSLAQLPDPRMRFDRQPLISGTGERGHTISLQWLASRGASLLGRIRAVEAETLLLDDTVGACLRHGDTGSATFRRTADEAMLAAGLELPPAEDDPADLPHPDPEGVHSPPVLDLAREGVGSVIWATGVRGAFDWLPPGVLDADAAPVHEGGVMPMPGLFVLGLPWLTRRSSGVIFGIGPDAARTAAHVGAHLGARTARRVTP